MSVLPRMPLRTLPFAPISRYSSRDSPAAEIEPSLVTLPVAPAATLMPPGAGERKGRTARPLASTFQIRLTVWFDRPPTAASCGDATMPASSTTAVPNTLPVLSTSMLLPATRTYCAGRFRTASPLIAPAIVTLPVVGTVPNEMYELPYDGGVGIT